VFLVYRFTGSTVMWCLVFGTIFDSVLVVSVVIVRFKLALFCVIYYSVILPTGEIKCICCLSVILSNCLQHF